MTNVAGESVSDLPPMSGFEKNWDRIGALNIVLAPLSGLYALGWRCYASIYSTGQKRAHEPHCPVVCIGNLSAGGVGKTPFSLYIAEKIRSTGRKVVIGMSGYGAPRSKDATWCPANSALDSSEWGDEPALARLRFPDIPLVVGRDRVMAAEIVQREMPDAVLVMDDGFQHLPLRKHLSIILDPPRPNQFCFPAGPMREPRAGLARADLILPAGIFSLKFSSVFCLAKDGLNDASHDDLPKSVHLVSAIGNPGRFETSVVEAGIEVIGHTIRRDHDRLSDPDLLQSISSDVPLMVTLKDWVKLRDRKDIEGRILWVADLRASVEPEAAFLEWLYGRLGEIETEGN